LNDIAFIEKVILAIFLRIFYEITKKKKIADENDIIKSLNNSISVIASNIIHINSFMYEPLIDVSIDEIKKTVIKCVEVLDLDMLSNQKNRG
jgi:hypothetical protein